MSIESLMIADRRIAADEPPYVIAELSANHNGSLETALKIVDEAANAGADAVKLQTYRPDTITLDSSEPDFMIDDGLWKGRRLFELYEEAHLPWEWHRPIFDRANAAGITAFSSVFDATAVDFLEDLGAPAYKIASFEAIDLPLIRYAAATGKPLIISTGMADQEEIQEAIDAARGGGCTDLAILHCVSGYPAPASDYNLKTIPDMVERFGVAVGLSDHTLGNATAIASIALGAKLIEKHFTLDRAGGSPDDAFSAEPRELAELCKQTVEVWRALGSVDYGRKSSESGNIQFRRSLYFVKSLKAGDTVSADAIRSVRPGFGVPPKYFDEIVGRKVLRDVNPNTPVHLNMLE